MSVEGGGDSGPKTSKLNQFEQAEFACGAKLTGDCINLWRDVVAWFDCKDMGIEDRVGPLKPIEHYEAYYRRVRHQNPEGAEELIRRSDPTAVAAFNALADEFNSHMDIILKKGREEAIKYVHRVEKIIK